MKCPSACRACWWLVDVPPGFDGETYQPAMRWCGHPEHVNGDYRLNCEKWGDRTAAIPERKPQKEKTNV